MRNELELLSTIEKYLNNELTAEEKATFEKKLATDTQLQEAVTLQREIMEGLEQAALKQQIQTAQKKYKRIRRIKQWGIAAVVIAVSTIAILLYAGSRQHGHASSTLPEYNEQHQPQWADADKNLPPQLFDINAGQDTIVETQNGIVVQIPANGFLYENGQPVTGPIQLTVKEALDAAAIMQAGLSSTAGNQLLESVGMFYVAARQHEKILSINPATGLHVELPADTIQPRMHLYKGNRLTNGTIDWVDPKPLVHDLTTVDINLLNFYPPRYLDSLATWGYDIHNKKFTDSLYYSFAECFHPDRLMYDERLPYPDSASDLPYYSCEGKAINPAKIKAIWNDKFQNTILATREFEERLRIIHLVNSAELLDAYVESVDRKLYEIDSAIAVKIQAPYKKQFADFAARHDGGVSLSSPRTEKLRRYYATKAKAFTDAIAKTNREFWKKQAQLNEMADKQQHKHDADSLNRVQQLFTEEFAINLKSACEQLGISKNIPLRLPTAPVYKVDIVETGWYNIDRAVYEATTTRTTLNIVDSTTGKKATIKYQAASFEIIQPDQFDQLYVYLLPDQLSSFIRLTDSFGKYTYSLNELLQYKLVCIGYRGEQAFYYAQEHVEAKAYTGIDLSPINKQDLQKQLNRQGRGHQSIDLKKDLDFYQFMNKDAKRQLHNQELWELRIKTGNIILSGQYAPGEGASSCCYFTPAK